MSYTLSIIIPAYNEEKTIDIILDKVLAVKLPDSGRMEIIIVNDCSKDNTEQKVNEYLKLHPDSGMVLISHEVNKGKGAAIHTGIKNAKGDYIIVQDADTEYDPSE